MVIRNGYPYCHSSDRNNFCFLQKVFLDLYLILFEILCDFGIFFNLRGEISNYLLVGWYVAFDRRCVALLFVKHNELILPLWGPYGIYMVLPSVPVNTCTGHYAGFICACIGLRAAMHKLAHTAPFAPIQIPHRTCAGFETLFLVNSDTRQTDRKQCIRAHRAYAQEC